MFRIKVNFQPALVFQYGETATMRTGGDDIAQALALIGVKPKWATGSNRVQDFEVLPLSVLNRPRVDGHLACVPAFFGMPF